MIRLGLQGRCNRASNGSLSRERPAAAPPPIEEARSSTLDRLLRGWGRAERDTEKGSSRPRVEPNSLQCPRPSGISPPETGQSRSGQSEASWDLAEKTRSPARARSARPTPSGKAPVSPAAAKRPRLEYPR